MARYQAILAYDGTGYAGFQRQADDSGPTIQGVVEGVLRQLGWQGRALLGAGRTDTGVHASGQVIGFDLDWRHSPESLRSALNAHLPLDIAVMALKTTRPDFHPRYDATGRRYHYRIFCRDGRDPLRERYAWRVWPAGDIERMNTAAALLVGEHDFRAFGTPPRAESRTVRTVFSAGWRRSAGLSVQSLSTAFPQAPSVEEWEFEIVANAFLYHMVRRVVYVLVAIGQGRMEISELQKALEEPPPSPLQGLAPPHGLFLAEVLYPEDVHERNRSGRKRIETEVSAGTDLNNQKQV